MKKATLHDTLFLRANSKIVRILLQKMADEIEMAHTAVGAAERAAAAAASHSSMAMVMERLVAELPVANVGVSPVVDADKDDDDSAFAELDWLTNGNDDDFF